MVYYNPYITGQCNPLYNLTKDMFLEDVPWQHWPIGSFFGSMHGMGVLKNA